MLKGLAAIIIVVIVILFIFMLVIIMLKHGLLKDMCNMLLMILLSFLPLWSLIPVSFSYNEGWDPVSLFLASLSSSLAICTQYLS